MNIGQIDEANEIFINMYKSFGYKTRTQLINDALFLLKQKKEKVQQENWLRASFKEMESTKPDLAFESIDGEKFVY